MAGKPKKLYFNWNYLDHLDNHNGKCTRHNCLYVANALIDKLKKIVSKKKQASNGNASA